LARDSGNSFCGDEIVVHLRVWLWKQSQRRDGRTDGCGDSSSYKSVAAVVAAEKACPWRFARFAWMLPSPDWLPSTTALFDLIWFDFLFLTGEIYKMKKEWKLKWSWKALFQSSQVWEQNR
jgi:hypothetical protein